MASRLETSFACLTMHKGTSVAERRGDERFIRHTLPWQLIGGSPMQNGLDCDDVQQVLIRGLLIVMKLQRIAVEIVFTPDVNPRFEESRLHSAFMSS